MYEFLGLRVSEAHDFPKCKANLFELKTETRKEKTSFSIRKATKEVDILDNLYQYGVPMSYWFYSIINETKDDMLVMLQSTIDEDFTSEHISKKKYLQQYTMAQAIYQFAKYNFENGNKLYWKRFGLEVIEKESIYRVWLIQ